MIVEGRAIVIEQDDVDTDVLYPGAFLNVLDPAEMPRYLFAGLDPSLRDQLGGDTILVAGANFGTGSSRENVPLAMRAAGIRCVVAQSFARIFRRNCVNLGLLAVEAPGIEASLGSRVLIDTEAGTVQVDGREFPNAPIAAVVEELQSAGGLVAHARAKATDRSA